MTESLKCAFCGVEAGHDEAIESGWTPYFFWDAATCCDEPVCPGCAAKYLCDFENEPIVKERSEEDRRN